MNESPNISLDNESGKISTPNASLPKTTKADLCISYVPADCETVNKICSILKERYTCFLLPADKTENSSSNSEETKDAIRDCKYFIPFFSRNYFNKDNTAIVKSHLRAAIGQNVLPIFVDNMKWEDIPQKENVPTADSFEYIIDSLSLKESEASGVSVKIKELSLPFYGEGAKNHENNITENLFEYIYKAFSKVAFEPTSDKKEKLHTINTVFISYSHRDKNIVENVYEKLKNKYDCWWIDFDKDNLQSWTNFNAPIFRAIKNCKAFVSFISKNYFKSTFCLDYELSNAYKFKKNIIPVFLDNIDFSSLDEKFDYYQMILGELSAIEPVACDQGFNEGDEDTICESILSTTAFKLLNLWKYGLPGIIPNVNHRCESILNKLLMHLENQKKHVGNYISSDEISYKLFPSIEEGNKDKEEAEEADEDEDDGISSADEDDRNAEDVDFDEDEKDKSESKCGYLIQGDTKIYKTPLIKHMESSASKHCFLIGEGGLGKSTTLFESCKWLLASGEYAVYIPLKDLDENTTVEEYIKKVVFGGNSQMFALAENNMKSSSVPFYVFLDGLNEMYDSGRLINNLENSFLHAYKAVKLVISSRFESLRRFNVSYIKNDFSLIKLQGLTRQCITEYIESCGLEVPEKILHLLHTPLMLTLYCSAEKLKMGYSNDELAKEAIKLFSFPDTAAKILHNYCRTQLYKALVNNNKGFNTSAHFTLFEYVLPLIGLTMCKQNKLSIDGNTFLKYIRNPTSTKGKACDFDSYKNLKALETNNEVLINYNDNAPDLAIEIACNQLAFITLVSEDQTNKNYYFAHQVFRDFFAAEFLCLEMNICRSELIKDGENNKNSSAKDIFKTMELCETQYSDDVLAFVADLQNESSFMPKRDGSTGMWKCVNNKSPAESFLEVFRNSENEDKLSAEGFLEALRNLNVFQNPEMLKNPEVLKKFEAFKNSESDCEKNAIYNLYNVMRLGRNGNLFTCDFSDLDLRACDLNGVIFSEFDKNKTYTASFDRARIDSKCFYKSGHSAPITSMCISSDNILYTGDVTGKVFSWDLNDIKKNVLTEPKREYTVTNDKIIRIALTSDEKKLLAVSNHSLTVFDTVSEAVTEQHTVPAYKYLKDAREAPDSKDSAFRAEVIYDTDPLTWVPIDSINTGNITNQNCALSGCIRKRPDNSGIYAYGNSDGAIRTNNHCFYSLYQHLCNEIQSKKNQGINQKVFYNVKGDSIIRDIRWSPSGKKLLVAYSNTLFEFEYTDDNMLKYLSYAAFEGSVFTADYLKDGKVIVCHSVYIDIMETSNNTLTDSEYEFSCSYTPNIITTLRKDDMTYLLSTKRELKILDGDLTVKHVRQLKKSVQNVCFAKDLNTDEDFICLLIKKGDSIFCERYDFFSDKYKEPGSDYKIMDNRDVYSDDPHICFCNRNSKKILSFHRTSQKIDEYKNRGGIFISGCSFKNLKGKTDQITEIITQNGGKTD